MSEWQHDNRDFIIDAFMNANNNSGSPKAFVSFLSLAKLYLWGQMEEE